MVVEQGYAQNIAGHQLADVTYASCAEEGMAVEQAGCGAVDHLLQMTWMQPAALPQLYGIPFVGEGLALHKRSQLS